MTALEEFERLRTAPFVKWAGGKSQLLQRFERYFPKSFDTYFEPFLGGGAVFFHLYNRGLIKSAVISDLNKDLINCYIAIRDHLGDLLHQLQLLQRHARDKDYYNYARKRFNNITLRTGEEGEVEKAALLLYLNKTCYNGLYRVNRKGGFNVPWGRYKNARIYNPDNLKAVSLALNTLEAKVLCRNYKEIRKEVKSRDFVYFDPPYQPISKTSNFTSYTQEAFSEQQQKELAELFEELASRGCYLMLSNSPEVRDFYERDRRSYTIRTLKATRAISSVGSKRGPIDELLVMNY